jgi:CO/xanthine dehydrogenase FAD-binding subunit
LTALGAQIVLASSKEKRVLAIEDFFTGKGEQPFALEPGEMVTEIRIPFTSNTSGNSFHKLTYRSAIDFALVSAAARIEIDKGGVSGLRIAVGGAGASPLLLREAAETLMGKDVQDDEALRVTADQVRKHASAFMVENLGAPLAYRQKMAGVMAKRAIKEAMEKAMS